MTKRIGIEIAMYPDETEVSTAPITEFPKPGIETQLVMYRKERIRTKTILPVAKIRAMGNGISIRVISWLKLDET